MTSRELEVRELGRGSYMQIYLVKWPGMLWQFFLGDFMKLYDLRLFGIRSRNIETSHCDVCIILIDLD